MLKITDVNTEGDYMKYMSEMNNVDTSSLAGSIRVIANAEAYVVFQVLINKINELERKIQQLQQRRIG